MRNRNGGFLALVVLGIYAVWRNRFAIQRQLESLGIRTPLLTGNIGEVVRSGVSKVGGQVEHGSNLAENRINRRAS